jgi:AcrR family transcriptional regulator
MNDRAQRAGAAGEGRRERLSAAQRRSALIEAAAIEFANGGLHGTPVARIARRVGVAQPYVFSLFASKLELFLAAVGYGFERVAETFSAAAADFHAGRAGPECEDALAAMGIAYKRMLAEDRVFLMLQLQSYAACEEPAVRTLVRTRYARLVALVQELSGAQEEQVDEFFRHGMALNVAAAMRVEDIATGCEWVQAELRAAGQSAP